MCSVRVDCLADALNRGDFAYWVLDGLTPRERRELLRHPSTTTVQANPGHPVARLNLYESADGAASVFLELIHRTEAVTRPEYIALYLGLWERLWAAAAHGRDAIEMIQGMR